MGVLLTTQEDAPYSVERSAVAIDMAVERVNREYLNGGTHRLVTILKTYGPQCDSKLAPGEYTLISNNMMQIIMMEQTSLGEYVLMYNDAM